MEIFSALADAVSRGVLRKYLTYKEWKFLHNVFMFSLNLERLCKYLTYKEWKQDCLSHRCSWAAKDSKYLTYKEWKRYRKHVIVICFRKCKYLTYKEWKRAFLNVQADCR